MTRKNCTRRIRNLSGASLCLLLLAAASPNSSAMMKHGNMMMDETGMIMNANADNLPRDCKEISEDVDIVIRAGHEHARKFPGKMFAFDRQEWDVKPCSRINITFINDDQIRHQMMIHGLPGYLYPDGMVHLELYGQGELKASLIVPSRPKTYLVHCEIPQHMEKGMKAQLKVDGGDGDLPSIPGISEAVTPDVYPVAWSQTTWIALIASLTLGLAVPIIGGIWLNKRLQAKKLSTEDKATVDQDSAPGSSSKDTENTSMLNDDDDDNDGD